MNPRPLAFEGKRSTAELLLPTLGMTRVRTGNLYIGPTAPNRNPFTYSRRGLMRVVGVESAAARQRIPRRPYDPRGVEPLQEDVKPSRRNPYAGPQRCPIWDEIPAPQVHLKLNLGHSQNQIRPLRSETGQRPKPNENRTRLRHGSRTTVAVVGSDGLEPPRA